MKRIFDEKGRLFGRISVVDLLVVAVVLVLGFAVYSRFFTKETTATMVENDRFTYTLRIHNVRNVTAEALRVGDAIYAATNDTPLGVIRDIRVEDCYLETSTMDGSLVYAPSEDRYSIYLTVDAEGVISNDRYYASRTYELGVNGSVGFYTKYVQTSGTVWQLD